MTGNALPPPSSVSVSVLNGTGASNQAADTAAALTALGYHVVGVGDTTPVGDVSETYVYYGSRDPARPRPPPNRSPGRCPAPVTWAYDPAKVADGAQVTVVTGSQFSVNTPSSPPSAPGTGTNASTSPSTTTSTTSVPAASGSAADAIAAPTFTTQSAPWDPRACAPGAVPGCTDPQSDLSNAPRRGGFETGDSP